MSPSIVITDELATKSDWECAYNVVCSGIKIIASCHSDNIYHLINKEHFNKNVFDNYAILSNKPCGVLKNVYI